MNSADGAQWADVRLTGGRLPDWPDQISKYRSSSSDSLISCGPLVLPVVASVVSDTCNASPAV
jgi:hypothetical protein